MPYLTGDTLPARYICRVVRIPDVQWAIEAVNGALLCLAEAWNWETFGAVTAQQATERFWSVWQEYQKSMCVSIGSVIGFAGSVLSDNVLLCDGSTYLIADYPQLFDAIGYLYGGSGDSFSVPNLGSRAIVGVGPGGGGLTAYALGDQGGAEAVTLDVSAMPAHSHTNTPHSHSEGNATLSAAVVVPADGPSAVPGVGVTGASGVAIDNTGGGGAHENRQPFLALNWVIVAL